MQTAFTTNHQGLNGITPLEQKALDIMVSPSKLGLLFYLYSNERGLPIEALKILVDYHPQTLHTHIKEMKEAGTVEQCGLCYQLTELGKSVYKVVQNIARNVDLKQTTKK